MGLLRPNIIALAPYSTARDEFDGTVDISCWIDANESPYNNGINRYPDPHHRVLKKKISEIKGVECANIFLGNGSDEAIDILYRIFCRPGVDNAVAIAPTYGMYEVAANINDVEYRSVMLEPDFSLPVGKILNACDANTKLLWICSPNNPTGNAFPISEIKKIADSFRGIMVVDEAYVDFSSCGSFLPYLKEHPNVVLLQTMSKARGMAALRVGMAFAHPNIINCMNNVKYPYNINTLSQQKALETLCSDDYEEHLKEVLKLRSYLENALKKLPCVKKVWPSNANFLLVQVDDADTVYQLLKDHGILVRNRNTTPGCRGCLRITVGTPQETQTVITTLANITNTSH